MHLGNVCTAAILIYLLQSLYFPSLSYTRLKIGMLFVLSLGGLIIVAAITRIVTTMQDRTNPELSLLQLWSEIECTTAIVVCCAFGISRLIRRYREARASQKGKWNDSEATLVRTRTKYDKHIERVRDEPDEMDLPRRLKSAWPLRECSSFDWR